MRVRTSYILGTQRMMTLRWRIQEKLLQIS